MTSQFLTEWPTSSYQLLSGTSEEGNRPGCFSAPQASSPAGMLVIFGPTLQRGEDPLNRKSPGVPPSSSCISWPLATDWLKLYVALWHSDGAEKGKPQRAREPSCFQYWMTSFPLKSPHIPNPNDPRCKRTTPRNMRFTVFAQNTSRPMSLRVQVRGKHKSNKRVESLKANLFELMWCIKLASIILNVTDSCAVLTDVNLPHSLPLHSSNRWVF